MDENTIIMGRKTWDSLGGRPLPNRRHIVITRKKDFVAKGAEELLIPLNGPE